MEEGCSLNTTAIDNHKGAREGKEKGKNNDNDDKPDESHRN